MRKIRQLPTIEAEPVVHGCWVDRYGENYSNHLFECSNCKKAALYTVKIDELCTSYLVQNCTDFCPHCGTKMDVKGVELNGR